MLGWLPFIRKFAKLVFLGDSFSRCLLDRNTGDTPRTHGTLLIAIWSILARKDYASNDELGLQDNKQSDTTMMLRASQNDGQTSFFSSDVTDHVAVVSTFCSSFKNVWRFSSRSTSKIFSTSVLRGFDSEFANKVLNLCYLYL